MGTVTINKSFVQNGIQIEEETITVKLLSGEQGPAGPQGIQGEVGPQGEQGDPGTDGTNGQGVPAGGTVGEIIEKIDGVDYNTRWIHKPSGGGALTAYKTIDETKTNDSTLVIDDDLQVELEANSHYTFMLKINRTANTLGDIKIGFTKPSGMTGNHTYDIGGVNEVMFDFTFTGTLPTSTTGNVEGLTLLGHIITSSAGTFGLQWAQSNSYFLGTTLKEGSYIILNKLD